MGGKGEFACSEFYSLKNHKNKEKNLPALLVCFPGLRSDLLLASTSFSPSFPTWLGSPSVGSSAFGVRLSWAGHGGGFGGGFGGTVNEVMYDDDGLKRIPLHVLFVEPVHRYHLLPTIRHEARVSMLSPRSSYPCQTLNFFFC